MTGKIKAVVQPKKDVDYVWTCDYCGSEFSTKKESDKHELVCKNNPKNKSRDIIIKVPAWFGFAFIGMVIFLIFVGLVRAVNNSDKLNQNSINEKLEQLADPTIIPISPTIKPTQKQTVLESNNTSKATNTGGNIECVGPDGKNFYTTMTACTELNQKWGKSADYMVNCKMGASCGGGTKRIKKSECDNGRCCQLNTGWRFVSSENECENLQNAEGQGSQSSCTKVAFTTIYASTPGTFYCCDSAVNQLLNSRENQAKFEYEMREKNCVNPSDELCKLFTTNFSNEQDKLDGYIKQYCK